MLRDPLTIFYLMFVYGAGMLVRLPASDLPLDLAILTSLIIDTLLIAVVILVARQFLGRLTDRIPLTWLVPLSVGLAFVSGGIAFLVVHSVRTFTGILPSSAFETIAVFSYFTMLAALYNLQTMWVRHARLASERALEVANAERRAALSELRRLRTQIQPHFLFNVLNNIQIEIGNSPAQASKMLSMLSDHLRNSLDLDDTLFVSLDADFHSVQSFVALQQMRFGTDFHLRFEVSEAARRSMVPAFLLLPLVENATKFGDRAAGGDLLITIAGEIDGDLLRISVANTGDLSKRRKDVPGTQTGLSNLRGRLALHYPDRHRFDLVQSGDKVVAQIELWGDPC